jgi:hypothetical protein
MRVPGASTFERTVRTRLPVRECVTMNERQCPACAARSETSRLTCPAAVSSGPLTRSSHTTWNAPGSSGDPNSPAARQRLQEPLHLALQLSARQFRSDVSNTAQRVPRSMLAMISRLRRCGVSSRAAALAAEPPASVLSASSRGLAERSDCSGLTPCAARRERSASVNSDCGRAAGPQQQFLVQARPATANAARRGARACPPRRRSWRTSRRGPRSRSNAVMRGKHISACSERNSKSCSPCNASSQDCHAAGGSTISNA